MWGVLKYWAFPSSPGSISRDFSEGYRPSLYCIKNDQGHQRSVFWQCPSKTHSFLSTFDITFIQIQVLRYYSARSWRKTVSVHISALISPSPGWERENYMETSGAFVIFVWVIKRQRKKRWIFHPTEMHMAVAGRTSFFRYFYLRRPKFF